MKEYELRVNLDKKDADFWRMEPNYLWNYIKDDFNLFFGPLADVIKRQIKINPELIDCYIEDFKDHSDEKMYKTELEEILGEEINLYSKLNKWLEGKKSYFIGSWGHYEEYNPLIQALHASPHWFAGEKGAGKTSLLLFTQNDLENKKNCFCVFIQAGIKENETPSKVGFIRNEIIAALDSKIIELTNKRGIKKNDVINNRFKRYWNGLLNDNKDKTDVSGETKNKKIMDIDKLKYSSEFYIYLQDSIDYMRDVLRVKVVIMIDDLDHLESDIVAKDICAIDNKIALKLGDTPVLVSIREETLAKLDDSGISDINKVSIIPPSFKKVLEKRYKKFKENYIFNKKIETELKMSKEDVDYFIEAMVNSFLERYTYANLVTFRYEMDFLLDAFRCIVSSPFIDPKKIAKEYEKNKKKKVPWHVIFDSLQRYRYLNFYTENSFFINVFDNDDISAITKNTLIRVRLLQVLSYLFQGRNVKCSVGKILTYMKAIGYSRDQVIKALIAFSKQRIIITWKKYNIFDYDDVPEILISPAIAYYLRELIYRYRYLQNILPVTRIPFGIPAEYSSLIGPILNDKKKVISRLIKDFISYIKDCEDQEKIDVKDKDAYMFEQITRNIVLSKKMMEEIEEEIAHMVESGKD